MDLASQLIASLTRLELLEGTAIVAVSGGPDSVALLHLLHDSRSRHGLSLVVAHADHGIHPESGSVAATVQDLAASLGYPCEVEQLQLGAGASETSAREARYRWLHAIAVRHGAAAILTAHHADDQAETVLMRLLAGSGPAGLAGMESRTGLLARPLLECRKPELVSYVREQGLTAWIDPANEDPDHLRSWIRSSLLPIVEARLPGAVDNLLRSGRLARDQRHAWDAVLSTLPALDCRVEPDGISVAAAPLAGYDSPLVNAVLAALGRRIGCVIGARRATRLRALLDSKQSGRWVPLGTGARAELAFGRLCLTRPTGAPATFRIDDAEGEAPWGPWTLRWRLEPGPAVHRRAGMTAWFAPAELMVRAVEPGDRIRPVGGQGTRLVTRCFQEAKIPRSRRGGWPVVASAGSAVWIPGICRANELIPEPGTEALRVDITGR